MSLMNRAALIFIAVTIILVSLLIGFSKFFLEKTFVNLERKSMEQKIVLLNNVKKREFETLNTLTTDWALWDDSYYFAKNRNQKFIEGNFTDDLLPNLKLNLMTFLNTKGETVYSTTMYNDKEIPNQKELNEFISSTVLTKVYIQKKKGQAGIIDFKGLRIMLSVCPIFKSNKKGSSAGMLVMAKFIDDEYFEHISEMTQMEINTLPISGYDNNVTFKDGFAFGKLIIKDILGKPSFIAQIKAPTDIVTYGYNSFKTFTMILPPAILVSLLLLFILIRYSIIGRIQKLQVQLADVKLDDEELHTLDISGEDEVAQLKDSINLVFHEFYEKNEELLHAEKLATIGKMVGGFAHEINNPVFAIKSSLELIELKISKLIEDEEKKESFSGAIDRTKIGIERLTHIVGALTSYVRANDGEKEVIDIHENIDKCMVLTEHLFKKNEIELATNFSAMPSTVLSNSGRFQQIITNLVSNAVDAVENRDLPKIEIATKNNEEQIVIEIIDNGCGIDDTKKVFETFYTSKPAGKGTGLGLDIVAQIVKSIDGTIDVSSKPGEGTTFIVSIPSHNGDL
jgi:signal transduction histidine kinase/sensor domain CHASE-containing protein